MTDKEAKQLADRILADLDSAALKANKLSLAGFEVDASLARKNTTEIQHSHTVYTFYPSLSVKRLIVE